MSEFVSKVGRLIVSVSAVLVALPVIAGAVTWLVQRHEATQSRAMLAAGVFLFGMGLVLMVSAVRRVDEVRCRQLFYRALQVRLRKGERLHRRRVDVLSRRGRFWLWRTERVIDRHYPEETERLKIGIGPLATIKDYTDNIRGLMQKQANQIRIAKQEAAGKPRWRML